MGRKYGFFGRFNTEEQIIRRKNLPKKPPAGVLYAVKLRAKRSRSFVNGRSGHESGISGHKLRSKSRSTSGVAIMIEIKILYNSLSRFRSNTKILGTNNNGPYLAQYLM